MAERSAHFQRLGRIGGLVSTAVRTPEQEAQRKQAAAAGRMKRFLDQVPTHVTDERERMAKALLLQRAHMQAIANTSARRRRKTSA